ncbi:MAG TPA: APC family permease [Candidatus Acidoferrales bacterium]|nr:APC family permease [Candidatus Acidoferrales bacterium]
MTTNPLLTKSASRPVARVVVATTAMLSFISFWRAAAIVLNDMGSSAFYAGAIAEEAFGKAAPWFILAIMLFSYAVRALYMESCSMFVRGGVYRVVKEAMGGQLAKISVSALMFDYILTGPISGVSAGQYLTGFLNDVFRYAHLHLVLPENLTAALFAIVVTLYFWWENVKGIPESSGKALRIMHVTTVMVVLMLGWCGYTLWVRGANMPPWPVPSNMHFADQALGWLRHTNWPYTIGIIGIFIGLGHSVLAMSGEETLAQVYRELEHPKIPNLKKVGFIIFAYSMVFTAGVSFFAVMIIPDSSRPAYFGNLISGLAMNFVGPYTIRLVFQAFVVLVGVLMLAGAVNTAIVGSNGVLNRVSEDGILPQWFRQPHRRFGTSYRIVNLVVGLQIATIILSRGNIFLLGEAYAFGVMWSFLMNSVAVLALRYKQPGAREFRVPLNLRIRDVEIPVGLVLITLTLLGLCTINLFTKQIATVSGIIFTAAFFTTFTVAERITKKRGAAGAELDQFNVASRTELSTATLGVRPGNVLVPVSNYHALYHLAAVLDRVKTERRDIIVLHVQILQRSGSAMEFETDQLFGSIEQYLFTKALAMAEQRGKPVRLAVVAANDLWDGILRAGVNLQSATIVLGRSTKMSLAEQARQFGLAWEALPDPRPPFNLEIFTPQGEHEFFLLGPHAPNLTRNEVNLVHQLWLRMADLVRPEELHHHDVVHFALNEVKQELEQGRENEVAQRLREHLTQNKTQREHPPS